MTDRNGTVHEYDDDLLAHPTADRVTSLAFGVDGSEELKVTGELKLSDPLTTKSASRGKCRARLRA